VCMAYIGGSLDVIRLFTNNPSSPVFCEPPGVTLEQLIAMTVKYLNDRPQQLHFNAASLIRNMLIEYFPCGRK
jgi:hypothetical protein